MNKAIIVVIFILFICNAVLSQNQNKVDIQIPSSPGMTIIGVQSSEITKPGNYSGLYTSLISPIISNNGTIPTDLSFEFSPYYLKSRDVTINELAKTDLYRDLKLSIASIEVNRSDSVSYSRLGVGFKTNLISGNLGIMSNNDVTLSVAGDVETAIFKIQTGTFGNIDTADVNKFIDHINHIEVKNKIEKIIKADKNNKDKVINNLESFKKEVELLIQVDKSRWDYSLRTGHFLELAAAIAIDFPANTLRSNNLERWGVWINYTYRDDSKSKWVDVGGILRISNYSFDPTVVFENEALFGDIGIGLNLNIPKTKLIISGEYIGKFGFSDFKTSEDDSSVEFTKVTESKWNGSLGLQITDNTLWSISLSEINGNSNYLDENAVQFLMGISAALVPLKK